MSAKKILLLALDLDDDPEILLKYAIDFSTYYNWDIYVLNVVEHHAIHIMGDDYIGKTARINEENTRRERRLNKLIENQNFKNRIITAKVKSGYIHREISEYAEKIGAGLIMLGKRKNSNGFVFERTIDQILSWTTIPSFVIPSGLKFSPLRNLLFRTSFDFEDFMAINFVKSFFSAIHVLQVSSNLNEILENNDKLNSFRSFGGEIQTVDKVIHPNLSTALIKYANQNQMDAIALVHRDRNIWDSIFHPGISRSLVLKSSVPVFVYQQFKNN